MKQKIYDELINWKNTNIQKTLMIIWARQIGKTYIIKKFCEKEFEKNIYINILEHPETIKNLLNNNKDILKFDKSIIEDIIQLYLDDMNKYVQNKSEAVKIETIYKSIPLQLGNKSNKFQYGKISSNARKRDY